MMTIRPTKRQRSHAVWLTVTAMFAWSLGQLSVRAGQSDGNFTVNANGSEPGDLTVEGQATLEGGVEIGGSLDVHGTLTLGTTAEATPQQAISYQYIENGTTYTVTVTATRASTTYRWRDGGASATSKMELDASNTLSLFNTAGTATIGLNPNTGDINLSSGGALVLSDGKRLGNSSDLRASALYDSSGNAKISVHPSGNLVVTSPVQFQGKVTAAGELEFAPGIKLDASNTAYLQQTIRNLGYRETPLPNDEVATSLGGIFSILDVELDSTGNFYASGIFSNSGRLGPSILTSAGGTDVFIAKISNTGTPLWAIRLGGPGYDSGYGIAVDASGNVYAAGHFEGTLTGTPQSLVSAGGTDAFVVKLSNTGTVLWATRFGGTSSDGVIAIAVDGTGNTYVTGGFHGTMTGLPQNLESAGSHDAYVAKINSSGSVIWATRMGGTNGDTASGVSLDPTGNVYISGWFADTMTGPPQSITSATAGVLDAFIAKLDNNGNILWASRFGGSSLDYAHSVAVDALGNAYLAGIFRSTTIGLPQNVTASGIGDAFVAKFNSSGNAEWAQRLGGNGIDYGYGVAVDSVGDVYTVGHFMASMTGVPQPVISNGLTDLFLAKLSGSGEISWVFAIGGPSNEGPAQQPLAIRGDSLCIAGSAGGNLTIGNKLISSGSFVYRRPLTPLPVSDAALAALGWGNSQAQAPGATAIGDLALATAKGAFAAGGGSSLGPNSFAAGIRTQASGLSSVALGSSTKASGDYTAALGTGTTASGMSATALGAYTTASGSGSLSSGSNATASGNLAVAFGSFTQAQAALTLALGQYNVGGYVDNQDGNPSNDGNTQWISADPLLEIGNGTSTSARSNALTFFKNATLRTAGKAEFKDGVRIPPNGDLDMGEFTAGENPATLNPATGLKYSGE